MVDISLEDVPFNFLMYGGIVLGLAAFVALALRGEHEPEAQTSGTGKGSYLDVYGNEEN